MLVLFGVCVAHEQFRSDQGLDGLEVLVMLLNLI